MRRSTLACALVAASVAVSIPAAAAAKSPPAAANKLSKINHVVVIYEENHSFDNLYGNWEGVNGVASADAAHTVQVSQAGAAYTSTELSDAYLARGAGLPALRISTTDPGTDPVDPDTLARVEDFVTALLEKIDAEIGPELA